MICRRLNRCWTSWKSGGSHRFWRSGYHSQRELAMQIARRPSGDMRTYPLVETVQVDGMLRELIAPAPDAESLQEEARRITETIAADCGVVGLLAVEFFQADGKLLINEIATRPHNSGHFSIEGRGDVAVRATSACSARSARWAARHSPHHGQ